MKCTVTFQVWKDPVSEGKSTIILISLCGALCFNLSKVVVILRNRRKLEVLSETVRGQGKYKYKYCTSSKI